MVSSSTFSIIGCSADARQITFCILFSQLLSGKFRRTQTSITDSSAPYKAKNDRVSQVYHWLSSIHDEPVFQLSLSFLYSGQHLDSDRPARTRQPSPSIPGKVQICSQVTITRVHYVPSVRGVTSDLSDGISWSHIFHSSLSLQSDCVCSGQRHLPEGSKRRGRVSVCLVDRHCDLKKCPGSPGGVQQTRCNKIFALKITPHITVWSSFQFSFSISWNNCSRVPLFCRYPNGKVC